MAWLGNLLLKGFMGEEKNPSKVLEVRSDKFSDQRIVAREDSVFLYEGRDQKYEIVMHKPCTESLYQAYSLFRAEERSDAEIKFLTLKDKLPILVNISSTNLNTIQKYCNTIQEYPSWNICHLAVYFNLTDSVQHPQVVVQLNSTDPSTGLSPLQIAVKESNLAMINKLITLGASLEHLDHEGNTVFHYAACTTKEIIMALTGKSKESRVLNQRNVYGQTPLHSACLSDKPDCVRALLLCGADVNMAATSPTTRATTTPPGIIGDFLADNPNKLQSNEMKYGGTPLHWSSSKEVIEALIDCHCDINALNFESKTALHVMVLRNRLECVVALLSREADSSIGDSDGNTPLHLAVREKFNTIAQALVVFGADLNLLNNQGWSPRHLAGQESTPASETILYTLHSVGAERCKVVLESCTDACRPGGTRDGTPPPPPPSPQPRSVGERLEAAAVLLASAPPTGLRGGRLLCLDGGGIRGLVMVTLLLHLESAVGKPILHCFDWLAATSTGAILALGLAAGKSLQECLCLYFRMKDVAFAGRRPYSSEPLEAMLKETLGTDTTMADIKHPKVMITGCLADRKPVDLHLFRNYQSPSEMLGPASKTTEPALEPPPPHHQQFIWEAARASGAAPSYFRAYGRFVDGGLISNNPTLDAITEIHEYNIALREVGRAHEAVEPTVIVSLGTGSVPVTQVECMDIFWPSGLLDTARLVAGVRSMQAVLVDQATQADGRVVDRTRAICSLLRIPYFRLSPQLSEEIVMDEKNDAKLVNMLWETKAYIVSQSQLVTRLAVLLNS